MRSIHLVTSAAHRPSHPRLSARAAATPVAAFGTYPGRHSQCSGPAVPKAAWAASAATWWGTLFEDAGALGATCHRFPTRVAALGFLPSLFGLRRGAAM